MSNYPKGSRENPKQHCRKRTRHFQGNQFTKEKSESEDANISASARKLESASSDDILSNPLHGYRIIEFATVFLALSELLICRVCKQGITFRESGERGLGFKIVVICQCGRANINSGPFIRNGFEINKRIVIVMRLLGIGRAGINLFCSLMDMCSGLTQGTYDSTIQRLHAASKSMFEFVTKKAVDEEKQKNSELERPLLQLKVSGDGTWKKRGFKSRYGVTTLIGYYSGKVIDIIVKSSYCSACSLWKNKTNSLEYEAWYEDHEEECTKNHEGSAGKMEVDAVTEMFLRSEEKFGVKYVNYIGDGDSKTYKAILNVNPYGEETPVVKSECVGHVEKRMWSRLQNVKKTHKLGGRGKLTDVVVKKLTTYYGLAIRRNINSVEDMKKDIMATFYHIFSTAENPSHDSCPKGDDSWCKWQKALAQQKDPKLLDLSPLLPQQLKQFLEPIYKELSNDNLLTRCLGGHTQNANESFNSTIWLMAPKHLHSGLHIVEIAAFIAAGLFNEGYGSIMYLFNELEIVIGPQCTIFAEQQDEMRITRQNRRSWHESKIARQARKQQLAKENELFEEAEGLLYGPGVAD